MAEYTPDEPILAADCNLESDHGSLVVLACYGGKLKVLDCEDLQEMWSIDLTEYFSGEMPKVSAVCCSLEREIVLGYSNGLSQSIIIKEKTQRHLLIAQNLFDDLENPPAVQQNGIKASVMDRLIFVSHTNYSEGKKVQKLKNSFLVIYSSETGEYVRHAKLPSIGILNMGVIESKKLLVVISEGENALYVINYQTCKDMV